MTNYSNFQEYCELHAKNNSLAASFLKPGKNSLKLALEQAQRQGLPQDIIERVEERGMLDGSFQLTYESAERIFRKWQESLDKKGRSVGKNYVDILSQLDPVRDSDLITVGYFCFDPNIREKAGGDFGKIYKVVLNAGVNKKRGYALPERQERTTRGTFIHSRLRDLLSALPKVESDEDAEYQRMMRVLINKKAERDVLPVFKHGERAAMDTLEGLIKKETDENIRDAYITLAQTYQNYLDLQLIGVNPDFVDPETGVKGVLPSLHQKIAIYHLIKERRFGIWDGGGTGKTAIGVLAIPMIIDALQKQGKEFRRAIVGCPNVAKKTWRRGLLGKSSERYLTDEYNDLLNTLITEDDKKDDEFLSSLQERKLIVTNYEQLTTQVNGGEKLFIDSLINLGVDYVIYDESQEIKALRETTHSGKPSHSAAARMLALNAEYYAPMSATPISNGLKDFAVQYHLLNPHLLPDPEKFTELIKNSPRILYTFFNEKSVRRNAEDINDDLDWTEKEHIVELDPVQRKIYDHIVEFRAKNWLHQARKCLLDPRLVDPHILKKIGALEEISWRNSIKYRTLEQCITANDGPVARDEKFVIFSNMFREGVTEKGHQGLRRTYEEMGLSPLYLKLELEKTLEVILTESLEKKFRKQFKIGILDGTISVEDREKVVDDLKDGLCGIICTGDTGGTSLDFTAANWVYFIDEDYVPDTEQQELWRELRKGQKRKVYVNHIRAENTLDISNRDYVDKKRITAKMAMDGIPPTKEEWSLLGDTEGKRFAELIKKSVGGVSINVYEAEVENIFDFEMKKRVRGTKKENAINHTDYTTTDAQKVMQLIGRDPLGCWSNPEFVELYMKALPNLSPHVVHTAKICDLMARAKQGEIQFPRRIVSEGSGPSLLYNSYHSLESVLKSNGFRIPYIVDRDTSQLMLDQGKNPNKVLGNMTGEKSAFKNGQFDMVDNESISLLKNANEVHRHLLEANRILKPQGLLELIVKNMKFMNSFYSGIEDLGFELISEKNQGFSLTRDAFRRLKKIHGEHFAESYSSKLGETYMLLAQKVDKPGTSNPSNFWFETLGDEEPEESIRDPRESRSIIIPGKNGRGNRKGRVKSKNGKAVAFENGLSTRKGRTARVNRNGIVEDISGGED